MASVAGSFNIQEFSDAGALLGGGRVYTYSYGTTTHKTAYTDKAGTVPHTYTADGLGGQYIALNARGELAAPLYLLSGSYDIALKRADGSTVWTRRADPVEDDVATLEGELAAAGGAGKLGFMIGQTYAVGTVGAKLQNTADLFDFLTPTQIAAVKASRTAPPTSANICDDKIQEAADSGNGRIFWPRGVYQQAKALVIRAGGTQNLTFVGESRTGTVLQPAATSIAFGVTNTNAQIINLNNDGKFSLDNLRFQSALAYTGVVLYAVEGGCADGSGQCIFSGSIRNCWFSLATPNAGIVRGALQNYQVRGNVFENAKACFLFDGPGTLDVLFDDNQVFNCYDGFIESKFDSIERRMVIVKNLNAYGHIRGPLINARKAVGWDISGVNLYGNDTDTPTSLGLFDFEDSTDLRVSSCGLESVAPYGLAQDAMVFSGTSGNFSKLKVKGADRGIVINGAAPVDLTFTDVDITSSRTSILVTTGAVSGRIVKNGGSWKGAQGSGLVSNAAAGNLALVMSGGQLLNAGLGGAAGTRLIDWNSAGVVQLNGVEFGRDDPTAAASYFFQGGGSGDWTVNGGRRIGTAPTADSIGSQPMKFSGVDGRAALYFGSASPQKGAWNRGDAVRNDTPSVGSPKGWTCTVAGGATSTTRSNSTVYAASVWAIWSTGTTVWEVTTAGTSAASAPSIVGKVVGDTVVDGTVTWTMRSLTTATFVSEGNL